MFGGIDIDVAYDMHPVGQEAEVGLVHAQHVLNRLAGDADFLADHPLAVLAATGEKIEADRISVVDRQRRILFDQRRDRAAIAKRFMQRAAKFPGLVHRYLPSW